MKYSDKWDLSTIPEAEFSSEHGRRMRAKGPRVTNIKLVPCPGCGKMRTARERQKRCECGGKG